jgi:hypothetical protein
LQRLASSSHSLFHSAIRLPSNVRYRRAGSGTPQHRRGAKRAPDPSKGAYRLRRAERSRSCEMGLRGGQRQALCLFTPSVALAAHLRTTFRSASRCSARLHGHCLQRPYFGSSFASVPADFPYLPKFNCATVNREALRARRKIIAGRQSSGPARQRGDMKTVRELSVGRPCITLGFVLRETASRISYRDRHGTSKFISKRWAVHTEPCPSCPDCPKTIYPEG